MVHVNVTVASCTGNCYCVWRRRVFLVN